MNIQFKKGVLELCVLVVLCRKDYYGYELVQAISKNIDIAEGTVYPLLRRLTKEGYFKTYIQESADGPARKYYQITDKGQGVPEGAPGGLAPLHQRREQPHRKGGSGMNKDTFLSELKRSLGRMPESEKKDVLYDYEEHFRMGAADGKSEEQVASSLGNPRLIGKSYAIDSLLEDRKDGREATAASVLRAVFASISLTFFNLIFILGPFVGLVGVMIGLWATAISLPIAGVSAVLSPIAALIVPQWVNLSGIGVAVWVFAGIGLAAIGVLAVIGMYLLSRLFLRDDRGLREAQRAHRDAQKVGEKRWHRIRISSVWFCVTAGVAVAALGVAALIALATGGFASLGRADAQVDQRETPSLAGVDQLRVESVSEDIHIKSGSADTLDAWFHGFVRGKIPGACPTWYWIGAGRS